MFCSFYKLVFSEQQVFVKTRFPIHQLYRFPLITIQDLLVPFGIFLKGEYQLEYLSTDEIFNPKRIELIGKISRFNLEKYLESKIEIQKTKEIKIDLIIQNSTKVQLLWKKRLD